LIASSHATIENETMFFPFGDTAFAEGAMEGSKKKKMRKKKKYNSKNQRKTG